MIKIAPITGATANVFVPNGFGLGKRNGREMWGPAQKLLSSPEHDGAGPFSQSCEREGFRRRECSSHGNSEGAGRQLMLFITRCYGLGANRMRRATFFEPCGPD